MIDLASAYSPARRVTYDRRENTNGKRSSRGYSRRVALREATLRRALLRTALRGRAICMRVTGKRA